MRSIFFFFNDTATTEIYTGWYTLSLHDALPISPPRAARQRGSTAGRRPRPHQHREIGRAHVSPVTPSNLVCRLLLEKKKNNAADNISNYSVPKKNQNQTKINHTI